MLTSGTITNLEELIDELNPLRSQLVEHPVYRVVANLEQLQIFTANHVFAVWDFMSLLKALQADLTCVSVPWTPPANAQVARLVNEIVLGEETDDLASGPTSHYELYLEAMSELGASTKLAELFIEALEKGFSVDKALEEAEVPAPAATFVRSTFSIVDSGSLPAIAAAFTFGREDVIPEMFSRLVDTLDAAHSDKLDGLRTYLVRHIELDGDEHGPAAENMMRLVCGDDPTAWEQALHGATVAIESRIALWDAMAELLSAIDPTKAADIDLTDSSAQRPAPART